MKIREIFFYKKTVFNLFFVWIMCHITGKGFRSKDKSFFKFLEMEKKNHIINEIGTRSWCDFTIEAFKNYQF